MEINFHLITLRNECAGIRRGNMSAKLTRIPRQDSQASLDRHQIRRNRRRQYARVCIYRH